MSDIKKTRLTINQILSPVTALIAAALEPYNEDAQRKRLLGMVLSGAVEVPEGKTAEAQVEEMIERQKARLSGKTFVPTAEQVSFVGSQVREYLKEEERERVSLKNTLLPYGTSDDATIFGVVRSYIEDQKTKQIEAAAKIAAAK